MTRIGFLHTLNRVMGPAMGDFMARTGDLNTLKGVVQ
jgi:hypothetical protein